MISAYHGQRDRFLSLCLACRGAAKAWLRDLRRVLFFMLLAWFGYNASACCLACRHVCFSACNVHEHEMIRMYRGTA